uniref:Protein FAM33A n=1 Tax=Cyprinus carpio carpio TaxID=630221 RepID=A0A9J7YMN0_CYPCA
MGLRSAASFIFPGLLQECKLFNMETVDKLEAMFQKAEADIEYVEKRLKFDFMANAREAGTVEGNPVQLLENLSAIKARHAALCAQVEEIAVEQKRSMDSIRAHLDTTVLMVQQLQNTADVQVPPLTEEEQEARDVLCSSVAALNVEAVLTEEPQTQAQSESQNVREEVSEGTFETVPRSVRGNLKLNDLNTFYKQLSEYFSDKNRGPISTQRMKKLNMKVSDSALKTLQHLKLIELDKKGLVSLLAKD